MAILGTDKLLDLIKNHNLIEGLDPNNTNIEGCNIDLRIGEVHEMAEGEGSLYIETRSSPKYNLLAKFDGKPGTIIKLMPGKIYSALTVEKINTLDNIYGWVVPRQTVFKAGIDFLGIITAPSYKGKFGFMLINHSDKPFEIELGARICSIAFHTVDGSIHNYIGQWQGGRAFIQEVEKQTKQV